MSFVSLMLTGFVLFSATTMQAANNDDAPKKSLCYLVVDSSGSIKDNKLSDPFRGAVVEVVGKLPPDTEVQLVFFNNKSTRPKTWYPMDLAAKGSFSQYFAEHFNPGGETALYDAVADVLLDIKKRADEFGRIRVVVLSDGEDNKSRRYAGWDGIDAVAREINDTLVRSSKGSFLLLWETCGFEPASQPPKSSSVIVQHTTLDPDLLAINLAKFFIAPKADFKASTQSLVAGGKVLFYLVDETGVTSQKWSFGDGSSSDDRNPDHIYTNPGSYTVSAEVRGIGGVDACSKTGFVEVLHLKPSAEFSISPAVLQPAEAADFKLSADAGVVSVKWTFGDGQGSAEKFVRHAYSSTGRYDVVLEVEGPGGKDRIEKKGAVQVIPADVPLKAQFDWTPKEVRVSSEITFIDQSQGGPTNWLWRGPDNFKSEERKPVLTFKTPGKVTVSLVVSRDGATAKTEQDLDVLPPKVIEANFDAKDRKGVVGMVVQFEDLSKCNNVLSRHWDFGDGGTSDLQNPTHKYETAGKFTPRLTIKTIDGDAKDPGNIVVEVKPLPIPMPLWLKWTAIVAALLCLWVFVLVPFLTSGARKKAESMTIDMGRGDARTLSECLSGRFSSLKTLLLPVLEARFGSGTGGSVEVPDCTDPCMTVLSPKSDGGCDVRAIVNLTVDGQPQVAGSATTSYPPANVKIAGENGGVVTLVIADVDSQEEV